MISELKTWVSAQIGAGYSYSMGAWVETSATGSSKYCVIQSAGGPGPDVDDRRPRFRIVLLGRRNERSDAATVLTDVNTLVVAGMNETPPCGAANIRAIGEPSGPGYTTENRAWVQVDFEVIF